MTLAKPYSGIFPIAPVPFHNNGDLDLDGMRRVLDCMIDQGVDGICILANYSEQFLLSDAERTTLLDLCLTHVAGRVTVIVTCPLTVHTRYWPLLKVVRFRVSSSAFVPNALTSPRSARPRLSQSTP